MTVFGRRRRCSIGAGEDPGATGDARVPVTVVVPLYDDRAGIEVCLDAIAAQEAQRARIDRVFVVDGGSTDGSRELVTARAERDGRIVMLDNPRRFVPAALNLAIERTKSPVVVRVDSHTTIAPDYVDAAVAALEETGADVVGGPMRPRGAGPVGDAVAWALTSSWGVGGSRFHFDGVAGESDSVYMGVFRRSTFERYGPFDERFARNQDDEFTYRVREHGGRVWLDPAIRSTYTPRANFRALFRQFSGYGRFKPLVVRTHPSGLRARHVVPPLVALAWLALPLALVRRRFLLLPAIHVAAVAAVARPERPGWSHRVRALLTMHLAYGLGFLRGLVGQPRA